MKLLIDAGNFRIKWGVHDGTEWCEQGVVPHIGITQLPLAWAHWPIKEVYASSVAREDVREALVAACTWPVHWVETRREGFGIRNHYLDPLQMGSDRWLAVLAARKQCSANVIVVCAGTALTVESLTQEGDFLGGLILPGYNVMLNSLAQATARLNQPVGQRVDFPCCTEDALASGVLEAMVGAIERARQRLAEYTRSVSPLVLITGGDAVHIAPLLASPVQIVDNLVLMGLLEVSNES